jgi:glycosyltransferase involved in cell wall biosynthesis
MANGMAALISQPEKRNAMGRKSLEKIADTFNWGRTVNEYMHLYDRLLVQSSLGLGQGQTEK